MNSFPTALLTHLEMSFLGVLIGCVVGVSLASALKTDSGRPKWFRRHRYHSNGADPRHADLLMLVFGLNDAAVIAAIFLYSLFPITRNTYVGLTNVPGGVLRAERESG